ncbi:ElyC/SanA/YdcF family protein [Actinoplanes sp. N902-109]|uniref:SanA/YdcF family protein n=1 Tax=Actinoplanes sp. (strain N902-109) TaxID=649831 RepID=UPI00059F0E0B
MLTAVTIPSRMIIWLRRLVLLGSLGVAASVLAMAAGDLWVRAAASGHVYEESTVPAAPVALVLGAEVYPDGSPSPFLAARLEIARQLLADGKVKAILVSGDHREWDYNEPGAMYEWLHQHGVPSERIVLDHAGFDTYDSCARAKRIFGVTALTVVTQSYHIDRAVTVCRDVGIEANGVADDSVRIYREPWYHSVVRERGAVVKAMLDVVSRRDPVFLGPHETGVDQATAG